MRDGIHVPGNTAAMDSGRTREVFGEEVEWGTDPARPEMGRRRFRCGCVLAEKDRGDWRVRTKCAAFESLHRAKLSDIHVLLNEEVDWDCESAATAKRPL